MTSVRKRARVWARAMHPGVRRVDKESACQIKDKDQQPTSKLRGKVLAFNISPKGQVEGALLRTAGGQAQVNFPKHEAEALSASMQLGKRVELEVKREPDEGDHPVFTVRAQPGALSGTVVRLNYALHGEVNGYHLDDGTFAHVKPEGAKKYKVQVGDQVKAVGERRPGVDAVVLEVRALEKLAGRRAQRVRA
jgi:hypothetical protein